ncbi:MAG: tetratricopeptide repeat protein, partial [Myxococcota bacterium]
LREAIALGEQLGEPQLIAQACEAICLHHLQRRELTDEVRLYQERAHDLYRQLGDRDGEARILGHIGLVHQRSGDYQVARQRFDEAISLHERRSNIWAAGRLYGRRGLLLFETRRLAEARGDLERAIAIMRQFGDFVREATDHLNLGCVELELGAHESARQHFQSARNLYTRVGQYPTQALVYVNLAVVELDCGAFIAAEGHLDKALTIARETEHHAWELMVVGNQGIAAQGLGDLARARIHLQRVQEALSRYPASWAALSTFLAHLGAVQAAVDDIEAADHTFAQCQKRINEGNHPHSLALVDCLLGFRDLACARRAGSAEEIREHLHRARARVAHNASTNCDLRIAQRLLQTALAAAGGI